MAKKVTGYLNLQCPAGKANPSPPIGPALGQRGLNIMEFCKAFNAKTQQLTPGAPIPVVITIYADRSFTFVTKQPPVSYMITQALNIKKGSSTPGRAVSGTLSMDQVRSIAEQKMADFNAHNMEAACKMVMGSARSMGIKVEG